MKRGLWLVAFSVFAIGVAGSRRQVLADPAAPAATGGLKVNGTVRSIQLPDPEEEPQLPPGPGRETTQALCAMCHTTRYIMIQPTFSRETWTAEITKMRKTFGGPIPEEKVPEILNYLMSVRGSEAK